MSLIKNILKLLLTIVSILLLLFALLIGYLSLREYRPEETAVVPVTGSAADALHEGDTIRIVTWNTGYGALGETADFFMDGGSHVETADAALVEKNISDILRGLRELDADVILLQEIDRDSSRSHHIDETARIQSGLAGQDGRSAMNYSFANNFLVSYVPYPVPPIGKVDSGLLTGSVYPVTESSRISLPCPFRWPVRTCNLKRCLMVDRIPLTDTDKELVVINLHLEAYDSGEGKIAQTRKLLEVLDAEAAKGNYVIAGGDFNQTFSNVDTRSYPVYENRWLPGIIDAADFGTGWSLLMDASVPTCRSLDQPLAGADPANFQFYVIDGFIVSDNLQVDAIRTQDLGFVNTDHNPVILDVKLL